MTGQPTAPSYCDPLSTASPFISPSKAPISLHSNAAAPNDLQCDFAPWKPDNNSVSLELLSFLSPSILVRPILIVYRVIQ